MSSPTGKAEDSLKLWTMLVQRWEVARAAHENALKISRGRNSKQVKILAAELANLKSQINDLIAEMQHQRKPDGDSLVFKLMVDEGTNALADETVLAKRRI
jgi:hypothetical protein